MTDKLDIVGIGNAMVDAIIPSNKNEVEKNNLNRDSMNLIDEDLKNSLHNNYSIKEMAGGGSLGNSMFGITSFGGNGSFIGKIKNDEVGKSFLIKTSLTAFLIVSQTFKYLLLFFLIFNITVIVQFLPH